MTDADSAQIFEQFTDLSLPKSRWTHEAHLVVCWVALSTRNPSQTLEFLRTAISRYNEATGVENTPTNGYHETLTRYYVGAVHHAAARSVEAAIAAPQCAVDAPGKHWSRKLLFSTRARTAWVEPDLRELPWSERQHL